MLNLLINHGIRMTHQSEEGRKRYIRFKLFLQTGNYKFLKELPKKHFTELGIPVAALRNAQASANSSLAC